MTTSRNKPELLAGDECLSKSSVAWDVMKLPIGKTRNINILVMGAHLTKGSKVLTVYHRQWP